MNIMPNMTDIKIQLPFNFRFFFGVTLFAVRYRVDISGEIRSLVMNTLQNDGRETGPVNRGCLSNWRTFYWKEYTLALE
jgi:hypothetical protein